jgi:hypothetical protein
MVWKGVDGCEMLWKGLEVVGGGGASTAQELKILRLSMRVKGCGRV